MSKKIQIQPRKSQVLVQQDEAESNEKYGIYSPSNVEKEQRSIGKVLAIGTEIDDIKVGDKIIFGAFAGEKITMQEDDKDNEYILLFDDDILALIK